MVTDPRASAKTYLETYLPAQVSTMTKDDGSTYLNYDVVYAWPEETEIAEFHVQRGFDLICFVGVPEPATPLISSDLTAYGYRQEIPIRVSAITKRDANDSIIITGSLARTKAELALRDLVSAQPTGSQYVMGRADNQDFDLGGDTLYLLTFSLIYRRDTTT